MTGSRVLRYLVGACLALVLAGGLASAAPVDDKMAEGMVALDKEDWDTAIAAFEEATKLEPGFVSAHFQLGLALYNKGKLKDDQDALDKAVTSFTETVRLAPKLPGAHFYLGEIYLMGAQYDKAQAEFWQELEVSAKADRPDAYEALGRCLMAKRDWIAAITAFSHAIDIDENHAWARFNRAKCYLELKKYDDVVSEMDKLNRVIMDYQSMRSRIDEAKAGKRRSPEDNEEVLMEKYSRVAKFRQDAMWPEVFKLQGKAFSLARQHIDARNAYRYALRESYGGNPTDLDVQVLVVREMVAEAEYRVRYKGDIQDPYRELEEADDQVTDILAVNADFAPALNMRGFLYSLMDEIYIPNPERGFEPKTFEEAKDALTKATQIYAAAAADPQALPSMRSPENYAEAERNLGRIATLQARRQGGQQDLFQEADAHFTKSLELDPDDPLTLSYQAQAKAELGARDESLKFGKDAVQMAPQIPETHTALGFALLKAGQPKEAAQELLVAIDRMPTYVEAWKLLGKAYLDMQSWSASIRAFRSALEEIPVSNVIRVAAELAEINYLMGVAYGKDSYFQEAIDQYNKALALNPSYIEAEIALGVAYRQIGRYEASLAAFEQAMGLQEGQDPTVYLAQIKYEQSMTLNEMGRVHAAYVAVQEALKYKANDPEFVKLLDAIRNRLTRPSAAGGPAVAPTSPPAAPTTGPAVAPAAQPAGPEKPAAGEKAPGGEKPAEGAAPAGVQPPEQGAKPAGDGKQGTEGKPEKDEGGKEPGK